ncbi:MAG: hypothetical protein ACK5PF_07560, partial [bacterium]
WHTFTSPQLPGLCVASTDLQKAYKDVALSIETLILLNCGQAVRAVAEQTFEKFFEAKASEIQVGDLLRRFSLQRDSVPA